METKTHVLKNQYHDSVALMLAAKQLKAHAEVVDAALVMGTEINKELLEQGGMLTADCQAAQPNDLIIAVKCRKDAEKYLDDAQSLLKHKSRQESTSKFQPHSVASAVHSHPDLNLIIISVGGSYAAREAREALAAGLHVLLFSDNVSIQDEITLKKLANLKNLLLMGPGAGTAIINGVGLGFANAIPRGNIGIVSAAGTGLQEVSTLIAKNGVGISQGIGTGGRDLSREVGGLTFFTGINALQDDPATEILVLISKPPDPEITQNLTKKLESSKKPAVLCLLGADIPENKKKNLYFAHTLEESAYTAVCLAKGISPDISQMIEKGNKKIESKIKTWKGKLRDSQRYIRGLYSGGTLCYEAQVILKTLLDLPVSSNAPLEKTNQLKDSSKSIGHCLVDLGEEEFTRGRPHPMIDNDLRIRQLRQEAADPETAVILLDVVIGFGAHPDPAGEMGDAIRQVSVGLEKKMRPVAFVASVTGTENDPQGLTRSQDLLRKANVIVCDSNAQAARYSAALVER